MKANGSGDVTAALFTAHLHTTGSPAEALAAHRQLGLRPAPEHPRLRRARAAPHPVAGRVRAPAAAVRGHAGPLTRHSGAAVAVSQPHPPAGRCGCATRSYGVSPAPRPAAVPPATRARSGRWLGSAAVLACAGHRRRARGPSVASVSPGGTEGHTQSRRRASVGLPVRIALASPGAPLAPVAGLEGRQLGVAVGTHEPQVGPGVVGRVAVHVVEHEAERQALPRRRPGADGAESALAPGTGGPGCSGPGRCRGRPPRSRATGPR